MTSELTNAQAYRKRGFFGSLSEQAQADLLAVGTRRQFRRHAAVLSQDAPSDYMAVLISGRVKVSSFTREGTEVMLALRGPGDLLGEFSALDGSPRSATVTAMEPTTAAIVNRADFLAFLGKHADVALSLLRQVTGRLRDSDRKRIEFGAQSTLGRVAARLVELADDFGTMGERGVTVSLPISQQELAGWVGASREAVSRSLRKLRDQGLIETARKQVIVLEAEALRARAKF